LFHIQQEKMGSNSSSDATDRHSSADSNGDSLCYGGRIPSMEEAHDNWNKDHPNEPFPSYTGSGSDDKKTDEPSDSNDSKETAESKK
jgi:hypothetical protein